MSEKKERGRPRLPAKSEKDLLIPVLQTMTKNIDKYYTTKEIKEQTIRSMGQKVHKNDLEPIGSGTRIEKTIGNLISHGTILKYVNRTDSLIGNGRQYKINNQGVDFIEKVSEKQDKNSLKIKKSEIKNSEIGLF